MHELRIKFDDSIIDRILEINNDNQKTVIGIFGPPGSGKSTFAKYLNDHLNNEFGTHFCSLAPMDGFHMSNRVLEVRGLLNKKGMPQTFDVDGYISLLKRLKENYNELILTPDYSRILHEPIAASIEIHPSTKIVLSEGNYLGMNDGRWSEARDLFGDLWYINGETNVLKDRLIKRQINCGKTQEEAIHWYDTVDSLNIELVEKTKTSANKILLFCSDQSIYKFSTNNN